MDNLTGEDFSNGARWRRVESLFAGEQAAEVLAYIEDFSAIQIGGNLGVSAISEAEVDAKVSNESTSAAVALKDANRPWRLASWWPKTWSTPMPEPGSMASRR